jgi:hypothetical protein
MVSSEVKTVSFVFREKLRVAACRPLKREPAGTAPSQGRHVIAIIGNHAAHVRQPFEASAVPKNRTATDEGSMAALAESYVDSARESHCLGTPNPRRSYARRAHASRSCPRNWMSPSVDSILGEQRQQSADQCPLYARQHRTGT